MGDNGKRKIYTKLIRVRLTPQQYDDLTVIAKHEGASVSSAVRGAITDKISIYRKVLTFLSLESMENQ